MENHETLITAELLAGELGNRDVRIVDCRFNLLQPEAGRQAYEEAHIPGAVYAHLDDDLAAAVTSTSGRHPLPDVAAIASFFANIGVDASTQVVVYDDASGAIAARAWWLLRWLGHNSVAVLDGGFGRWQAQGLPTKTGTEAVLPKHFDASPHPEMVFSTDEVLAAAESIAGLRLVDARDAARFCGEREPIDTVAGHIPGAVNLPCADNTRSDGCWKDAAELRKMWSETLPELADAPFGVMCGSGVTACHLVLSSLIAGFGEPRVYVGSWSEWIRDPGRPVATGAG